MVPAIVLVVLPAATLPQPEGKALAVSAKSSLGNGR